jgi:hypothetical protein
VRVWPSWTISDDRADGLLKVLAVDVFNSLITFLLRLYFGAFAWAPPVLGLTIFSAVAGVALLWVFQKTSNQNKIRSAKRLVQAHLMELRVFRDEPAVMWRAQKSLLVVNLRYLALMLIPALWMGLPLAILLVHLDAFYGRSPMVVGADSIVTVRMRSPLDRAAAAPALATPPGVRAETPAVRVLAEREVSWRIRSEKAVSDDLQITVNGDHISKRIEAGGAPRFVPGRRVSSTLEALWYPDESRVASQEVDWIDIRYPEARIRIFGFDMHWLVWFTLISMISALLLKRTFGVVI